MTAASTSKGAHSWTRNTEVCVQRCISEILRGKDKGGNDIAARNRWHMGVRQLGAADTYLRVIPTHQGDGEVEEF